MEDYYSKQGYLPHFASYNRQRGTGNGALGAGIGRRALPFAKNYILPAAKKIDKELLVQNVPEVFDNIAKRKSSREAVKTAMKKTIKKQIGGKSKHSSKKQKPLRNQNANRDVGPVSFQKSKMLHNILPLEASHSSLDIFERSPVLITFDSSFEQKIGPSYSSNGPTLEFEVVGDRNNFLDPQNFSRDKMQN